MGPTLSFPEKRMHAVCSIEMGGRPMAISAFDARLPLLDLHGFVEKAGARLISPSLADRLLEETSGWEGLPRHSPFATGAIIAYGRPGARLGKEIVYRDPDGAELILPTREYAGESMLALVALEVTARDLRREGKGAVLDVGRLIPVTDFPAESGWHLPHQATTVPHGREARGPSSRFLSRTKAPYVGPISRGLAFDGSSRDFVLADFGAYYKLGIVVEQDSSAIGL